MKTSLISLSVNSFRRQSLSATGIYSLSLGLLLSLPAAGQSLVIDDFVSSPSDSIERIVPGQTIERTFAASGVIGGNRYVTFSNNLGSLGQADMFFQNPPGGNSFSGRVTPLTVDNDTGATSAWAISYYGSVVGSGNTGPGTLRPSGFRHSGLGLDLSAFSALSMDWDREEVVGSTHDLLISDANGISHTVTYDAGIDPNVTVAPFNTGFRSGTATWDLQEYAVQGVDLTNIEFITLTGGAMGSMDDGVFGALTAVPEPSTSLMAGLSCGLLFFRRRKPTNC